MKKIKLLSLVFAFSLPLSTPFYTLASFVSKAPVSLGFQDWKCPKLRDYMNLTVQDITVIQGKKMSFWDKISFHIMKMTMKKEIKRNPNILVSEFYAKARKKRLAWGWWVAIAVGVLLILFLIFALVTVASISNG